MTHSDACLPEGYTEIFLEDIDSTNAEALRQAGSGSAGNIWVRAARQSAGRGRSGRQWISDKGNLFASLLLRPRCTIESAVQLAFVAGLAAHDALADMDNGLCGQLALKWPNDVLLDDAKLAGILLESVSPDAEGSPAVAIGIGLNLASHPDDTPTPATDLAAHGISVGPERAFSALARAMAYRVELWAGGRGWQQIRENWKERSVPTGRTVSAHLGSDKVIGTYRGIDDDGALLVDAGSSEPRRITAGDMFLL